MKKEEKKRTALKVRREMKDLFAHIKNSASVAARQIDEANSHDDAATYSSHNLDPILEAVRSIDKLVAELADFPGTLDDEMAKLGRYPTTDANGRKRYVSVPE